jgi:phosphomannomutase
MSFDLKGILKHTIKRGIIAGRVNRNMPPEMATVLGCLHGTILKTNDILVIARDFHKDSRMLKRAYAAGVMSTGVDLLNLHDATFPLLQFAIRRFGGSGGVYFHTGHLYNDDVEIILLDAGGIIYTESQLDEIIRMCTDYPDRIRRAIPINIGMISSIPHTTDIYVKSLPQFVNKAKISEANLKVVVDCSFGPTGRIAPNLLSSLDVDVVALNTFHQEKKKKSSVPDINSIRSCSEIVRASRSDLGICYSSDGQRFVIVDETGLEIDFEDLFMLFVTHDEKIQESKPNTIIISETASSILDNYVKRQGFNLIRKPSKPGMISRSIREERACFAAADSNEFYFPYFGPISDGTLTLIKLLDIMASKNALLSNLTRNFPKPNKISKKVTLDSKFIDNFHDFITKKINKHKLEYIDILNEVKIIKDGVNITIKISLSRDAVILSTEDDETKDTNEKLKEIEEILLE